MPLIKETNVTIMVSDMDKAVGFYESIGFTIKQRWDNNYAMMSTAGLTVGLHPSEDNNLQSGTVSIGLMIDQINEAKKLLEEKQILHEEPVNGGSGNYIYFKDPFGTVLYFVEPKWKTGV